ncbi:MAG: hypothetical protein ABIP03_13045 [Aquihabitans sp.]
MPDTTPDPQPAANPSEASTAPRDPEATAAAATIPDPPSLARDRFEVPVGSAGGFPSIIAALTRTLAGVATPAHEAAIFLYVVDRPARFTQCLVDIDAGAWVECVSNHYLEGDERQTPGQEQQIIDLGYRQPDAESPNFYALVEQPVDWGAVALMMVAPFVAVFPCADHESLKLIVNRHYNERPPDDEAE